MNKQTNVAIVKFNGAKTTVAAAMTPAQERLFAMGEDLGNEAAEHDVSWADALKAAKPGTTDRNILRAGFVSTYSKGAEAGTKAYKGAQNRFDYLARMHSPDTSRKAKSNAKRAKGGGRKETTATGKGEQLNASAIAQRMAAALHYIATAQRKHAGDDEMLEELGAIAAILGGSKAKK